MSTPNDILGEASVLLGEGKLLRALDMLRGLQRTNPTMPELNYTLARCYQQIGRHEQALESARRELKIRPDYEPAKQLATFLFEALSPPEISEEHARERPWHSSVPVEFLKSLQHRLHNFTYLGIPLLKNPFDLAIYSQLLSQERSLKWVPNPAEVPSGLLTNWRYFSRNSESSRST
jgi:tetratricopeptide (TPR) repeat protein